MHVQTVAVNQIYQINIALTERSLSFVLYRIRCHYLPTVVLLYFVIENQVEANGVT
jgi:hypothetical protein